MILILFWRSLCLFQGGFIKGGEVSFPSAGRCVLEGGTRLSAGYPGERNSKTSGTSEMFLPCISSRVASRIAAGKKRSLQVSKKVVK